MFGRQPCLPVEHGAKHFQICPKVKRHARWAQKKVEAFQAKEVQRHKHNYEKRGRAAAFEVWDMVLVCVTAFKGCHKIQDRWENREYVVESGPIPMCQSMWHTPGTGKGTTGFFIGTNCSPSALT